MKKQKGFVIPVIIAIVAVMALGGGYYYTQKSDFLKNDKKENIVENSEMASTRDETKDWKKYTNDIWGYSISYPKDWSVEEGHVYVNSQKDHIIFRRSNSLPGIPGDFWFGILSSSLGGSFETDIDCGKIQNTKIGLYEAKMKECLREGQSGPSLSYLIDNNGIKYELYILWNSQRDNIISTEILSTFKFISTTTPSCESKTDGQPIITSLSTSSGSIGTILEINGCNLSGFEGDLDVIFEKTNGQKIRLTDTFSSHVKTGDKLIKVKIEEPCQKGEKVVGRYSGIESVCDYVELTPGLYKVYTEPWGKKSNIVDFNITPSSLDDITNEIKDWKTYKNNEVTIFMTSLNGAFVNNNIFITTDTNGKKWSVDYTNTLFYRENLNANPSILSSDLGEWLRTSKIILTPGYNGPGDPGYIRIIGLVGEDGILYASKIIKHSQ